MSPRKHGRSGRPSWTEFALLALSVLLLIALGATSAEEGGTADAQTDGAVKPTCSESLRVKIGSASPGDTIDLKGDCIYRESVTIDKPLTLRGLGTAEIRGSDVWEGWARDGSVWKSSSSVPSFSVPSRYRCEGMDRRCRWPEQVFVDGEPLRQVLRDPEPGQFALDANRRVVLADDPAGRVVEVTVRERWILGATDGVAVQDITMKHAAGDGLSNGGHSGWTVKNNDLSYAHAKNLALALGDSLLAQNNDLHRAGQLGMSSNDAEVEISGNRVYDNNIEAFDAGWEAGGIKVSQPRMARITGNEVYDNKDIGIWTDVVNDEQASVEILENAVHHHPRAGIRVEITKNFEVRDNVLWENGWKDARFGAGITVAGSHSGTVAGNVLAWNSSGIAVVQQNRDGAGEQPYDAVRDVRLAGNRIIHAETPALPGRLAVLWNENADALAEGAPSPYDLAAGNGGSGNEYWFDGPEGEADRFRWEGQIRTLADLNATPADQNARYLSDVEKDALLRSNGVPPGPEAHSPPETSLLQWLCGLFRA
jgi:hypothetical protein